MTTLAVSEVKVYASIEPVSTLVTLLILAVPTAVVFPIEAVDTPVTTVVAVVLKVVELTLPVETETELILLITQQPLVLSTVS